MLKFIPNLFSIIGIIVYFKSSLKSFLLCLILTLSTACSSVSNKNTLIITSVRDHYTITPELIIQYQKLAKQHNPEAQYNLGVAYYLGIHIKQDYQKAFELFHLSAQQNYAPAYNNLGTMYQLGQATQKNTDKALELFHLSAQQNYSIAHFNISSMYIMGDGIEKNYTKAFEWFKTAAELNHPEAQLNLAMFYFNGITVKQDKETAKIWYQKSCHQDIHIACEALKEIKSRKHL